MIDEGRWTQGIKDESARRRRYCKPRYNRGDTAFTAKTKSGTEIKQNCINEIKNSEAMISERCRELKFDLSSFKRGLYYNKLESTNLKLFNLLGNDSEITDVVIAGQQSKGRGRRDNFWFSPPGGLWLSVVLPDVVCNRNITTLNITCGLSCAKACNAVIRDTGISDIRTYLRWPNDLILKCRKLGGLLIEVRTEGQNKRSIILGMGINVNQKKFPGDLDRSATSLLIQLNKRISRKKLAIKILEELDNMISYIKERQMNNVLQEWKFYSYEIGRNIKIETGSGIEKSGKVLGIGENGELIIVDNNGRIARIFNGYNLRLSDS